MISERGSDSTAALQIRIVRLQAAAQGQRHETLVDDVLALWEEGEVRPAARKLRRTVLRTIAGINHAEAEQAVQSIAAALPDGPERRMLAAKCVGSPPLLMRSGQSRDLNK